MNPLMLLNGSSLNLDVNNNKLTFIRRIKKGDSIYVYDAKSYRNKERGSTGPQTWNHQRNRKRFETWYKTQ